MSAKKNKAKVIKQNVGADMSKDDFKVSFHCLDENGRRYIKGSRTFKNTLVGFAEFMKWIEKKRIADLEVRITIEATGTYYENLVHFLDDNGYYVSVVLPNKSKNYAKSLNLKTKTDAVDAKMLGQMGIERDLKQWKRASPKMRTLKQLTRARVALLDEKTSVSNKIHALEYSFEPHKQVLRLAKQRLKFIKKQLKVIEEEIQKAIQADEVLAPKVEKILKAKGLGLFTIATVIAETNGFKLFTSIKQLVSYAGYDIIHRESGTSIKGKTRISKKGNRYIRRALYFPAISLVTHEPFFKQFFERILKRNGIKMKAYVAVQRKALVLIYTLFKNDVEFDPNFHNKSKEPKEPKKTEENGIQKVVDEILISPTLDACSKATSFVL